MTIRRWVIVGSAAVWPALTVGLLLIGAALSAVPLMALVSLVLLAVIAVFALIDISPFIVTQVRARLARRNAVDAESEGDGTSVDVTPAENRARAWRALLEYVGSRHPAVLLQFALSTRTRVAREALVHRMSGGQWHLEAVERIARHPSISDDDFRLLFGTVDLDPVMDLARVMLSAGPLPEDRAVVDWLLRGIARSPAWRSLSVVNLRRLVEALLRFGHDELAGKLVAETAKPDGSNRFFAADVVNPFVSEQSNPAEESWHAVFNGMYRAAAIEPVELLPATGAGTPFDRLAVGTRPEPADGPLVSVIMSAYRPDHGLRTAVRSIIDQSWSNWELLLIDDGSGAEYVPLLQEVAGWDSRIRLFLNDDNTGTYVRRNQGILAATGDFVTTHDSDDWAHPRRLEHQMRHLERSKAVANLSVSLRITDDLRLAQPRGTVLRITETSLLFRRRVVTEAIGYFDSVRRGADSGFRIRVERMFGEIPVVDRETPLTLVRFASDSLSGADYTDGWAHPARLAYNSAHEHWLQYGASAPHLPFPAEARPFPAPSRMLGVPKQHADIDVLYVFDTREAPSLAALSHAAESEMRALIHAGRRVGVRRAQTPGDRATSRYTRHSIQGLINDELLVEVLPGDDVAVGTIVVRHLSALLGVAIEQPLPPAENIVIVTASPAVDPPVIRGVRHSLVDLAWPHVATGDGSRVRFVEERQLASTLRALNGREWAQTTS